MSVIVRGDFAAIAAEAHAAPVPGVVLGRVIKKEHARRVLALPNQLEIARAQQVAGRLGE